MTPNLSASQGAGAVTPEPVPPDTPDPSCTNTRVSPFSGERSNGMFQMLSRLFPHDTGMRAVIDPSSDVMGFTSDEGAVGFPDGSSSPSTQSNAPENNAVASAAATAPTTAIRMPSRNRLDDREDFTEATPCLS